MTLNRLYSPTPQHDITLLTTHCPAMPNIQNTIQTERTRQDRTKQLIQYKNEISQKLRTMNKSRVSECKVKKMSFEFFLEGDG